MFSPLGQDVYQLGSRAGLFCVSLTTILNLITIAGASSVFSAPIFKTNGWDSDPVCCVTARHGQ